MTGPEVCEKVGMPAQQLRMLVDRGVVAPSGGGGHVRGQQQRWNERDIPVLMIVKHLLDAGAGPEEASRVVKFLHTLKRAPFGSLLIVGPTFGPDIASPERAGTMIRSAGEAVTVLDLDLVRRSLRERGVQW